MLEHLQALGLCHVEFAWQPGSGVAWGRELAELEAAVSAGCPYVVSPILERALQRRAAAAGARVLSSSFPAISLGLGYWQRLRDPLGGELPFAIAAGGLGPADVRPWLSAGVDAVALGSALLDPEPLRTLIATLPGTSLPVAMPRCRSESAVLPMRQRLPVDVSTHDSAQRQG